METLFTLSFDSVLGFAAIALTLVSLNSSAVQQPSAIAIPVRPNEK